MTTSTTRWGAALVPSVTCPLPTAHSPQEALKAYLDAKKQMPGLTPAAWRKAAAQKMGVDYDTYLALWKVHKGVASRLKMIPESKPTVPAAQSSAVNMGIKPAVKAAPKPPATYAEFSSELDDIVKNANKGLYTFEDVNKYVDELTNMLAAKIPGISGMDKVKLLSQASTIKKAFPSQMAKAEAKVVWKPSGTATTTSSKIKEVQDAYSAGKITYDEAFKYIDDLGLYNKAGIDEVLGYIKEVGDDVIQTIHGPLTHDLAQSVYKKMKKDMPTASPAVWRHEAAKYLNVSYDDYLKAWKKPTSLTQKAATTPASKLPPSTNTTLSPSPTGKYAKKDITPEELKDELAKAYGPGAKKEYINFTYLDHVNTYQVQFPKSLLPTQAAKDAVAKQLQDLGLEVTKEGGYYYIKSKVASKLAQTNAKQISQTGTYTLPDGTKVLDITEGDKWTNRWWADLSYQERAAWHRYTSSGYIDMNNYLRKGTYLDDAGKMAIKDVARSMQTVEHQITVFRGSPYPPISHFKVGNLWHDKGFMSTAVNPGSAWGGVKYVVTLPKGSRGMYIGKKSSHPHENEFLIDKGTEFRITKVEGNTVYLTAIPKKKV